MNRRRRASKLIRSFLLENVGVRSSAPHRSPVRSSVQATSVWPLALRAPGAGPLGPPLARPAKLRHGGVPPKRSFARHNGRARGRAGVVQSCRGPASDPRAASNADSGHAGPDRLPVSREVGIYAIYAAKTPSIDSPDD